MMPLSLDEISFLLNIIFSSTCFARRALNDLWPIRLRGNKASWRRSSPIMVNAWKIARLSLDGTLQCYPMTWSRGSVSEASRRRCERFHVSVWRKVLLRRKLQAARRRKYFMLDDFMMAEMDNRGAGRLSIEAGTYIGTYLMILCRFRHIDISVDINIIINDACHIMLWMVALLLVSWRRASPP